MTTAVRPDGPSREEFSERLLKGSVKKSYEPIVDIDWDAPLDPDKFYLPPRLVSLYGTPMWDEMTREQQIDLSRQELVNTLSAGIWFENMLNQIAVAHTPARGPHQPVDALQADRAGRRDPPHDHVRQSDRAHRRQAGAPAAVQRMVINALPLAFQRGSMLWVAALLGEEIFDSLQRQMMDDPELQPMIQRLMRIHVTEEARHIQFARDGARKRVTEMPRSTNGSWPTSTDSAGTSSATCSRSRSPTPGWGWTRNGHGRPHAPAHTATKCTRPDSPRWQRF